MMFFRSGLLVILSCCTLLSNGQLSDKNYKIFSAKTGSEITLDNIAEDIATADVVLFGEEHNDAVAHYLEAKLFEALYQRYPNAITLSLEMFDRDVQTVMNEYLSGAIREKNFIKDARVWNNYQDYRPMVEFAKSKGVNVICANAPSRYTNLAGRKGMQALKDLPVQSKKFFAPLPYDTATNRYYEKLMNLTGHTAASTDTAKKVLPVMSMGNFNLNLSQSLWDATMAYSIAKYLMKNKGKKILHVNGRFHSDERFAIVEQLAKYNSRLKVLVISTAPDDSFPDIKWEGFKMNGDYIIITDPSVPKSFKD